MTCVCEFRTVGFLDADLPYSLLVVPSGRNDLMLQLDVLHQAVLYSHVLEILPDLR